MKLPKLIPIEGNPSLVKDTESKAVLNVNVEAYQAYKKRREQERRTRNAINEIDEIKSDINEIKNLLKMLLSNKAT
jgi:NAD(P)H-nitrite reductase large subunit